MDKYRILVVDDEETICEILQLNLESEGYVVDVAYSAEEALKLDVASYSLLLLDIMMGEMSGYKMLQKLREREDTRNIPVIFCSAKDTKDDTITGLNLGADDYIAKPFLAREVVARVKSVLRRAASAASRVDVVPCSSVEFLSLKLDLNRKQCTIDGCDIPMTKKEFEILALLLQNRNTIFSRQDILSRVWDDEIIVVDRTIDVFITRLRKKIGVLGKHIVTRLGYGYGFYE
ncbi:MAG: response regulator transcription factor [Rikenellaceae bacterium]